MDRKEFLRKTVNLGVGAAAFSGKAGTAQDPPPAGDAQEKFRQAWIRSLMENLEAQVDESARTKLMEACGRACARRGAVNRIARPARGDVPKLLATLGRHIGKENARQEEGLIRLRYTKCYCPLVAAGPARLPDAYCECSRGWVLEVFETATGKPVRVDLTHSIKRGDPYCEFVIHV